MKRHLSVIAIAGVIALGASGAVVAQDADEEAGASTARTIYMAAVEPKGGTSVDSEPFPTEPLPAGPGYKIVEPNDDGRWEVSTYRWMPGTIVVTEGDEVTLEIVGINGAEHPFTIEGHDVTGTVTRGSVTTVGFTAGPAGAYRIICATHQPSMNADLIVLPAS